MEMPIIERAYHEVLNTMKRGIHPSLLVLGRDLYRQLQFEHYNNHDTHVSQVGILGFTLRVVVVEHDGILDIYGRELIPTPADIPEPPFLFRLSEDAALHTPLLYDIYPGVLYVAVAQKMDLGKSTFLVKPLGKDVWISSENIMEVPHISVN
jgi:hypothetical protein